MTGAVKSRSEINPTIHLSTPLNLLHQDVTLCVIFSPSDNSPKRQEHYTPAAPPRVVEGANRRVGAGRCEPVHAGCLPDPLCGDNPVLSNGKSTLRLHRGARPPRPTSLSRLATFQSRQQTPSCVYPFRRTQKSHIQASSLRPRSPDLQPALAGGLGSAASSTFIGFLVLLLQCGLQQK